MITIIKKGKIRHEYVCDVCRCEFTFNAEDVTEYTVWDDHGGHYPVCDYYKIKCPYCGYVISLNEKGFTDEEKEEMKHEQV